ncbi:RND family transporter [Pseudomonadota bacterium]
MVERYAKWLIRGRWVILALTVLWVIAAASGGRFLSFTNDYRVFFSDENPQLLAFEELQNTYSKNDNLLFVLTPKEGDVFTPEFLSIVEELTEAAWQTPHSTRVDSIANYQHTYAEYDDLVVESLVEDAMSLSEGDIARIREIVLKEPALVNRIVSPTGHVTGVNVTVQPPEIDTQAEVPEMVNFGRNLVTQMKEKYPDVDIRLTGIVMMNNAFPESGQNDVKTLVPLMFFLIILLVGFSLRLISGTFATLVVILCSIVSAMGLAGYVGVKLSPPTMSAPTVIMTIAVAHCVHILSNFMQAYYKLGDKAQALVESLRINFQPVFITSLTTMIGFLSMNFSDAPPFRDLGNIVALGVITGFVLSITVLPALMMVLPVKRPTQELRGWGVMHVIAEFVIKRRTPLMWGMITLAVILVAMIPKNELNDEFVKYFDESVDFRVDTDYTTDNLTGLYQISYSLGAGESGGISSPAYLEKLEEFAGWYRLQPEVLHVSVFTDIMKRVNRNMHGDDDEWYRVPEQRDLAAQYLLLYEMSLPYGLDLNNQINVDKSATRLNVSLHSLSTTKLLALEDRAQAWLQENAPGSMQVSGASPAIMFAHIGYRNIRSMLQGTTIALVLISLILIVVLRSFKIGLISLVPNLIPAMMAFGLWAVFVGQVGLALSVVVGMTLGIVVDDTVHFLSKYLRARRERGLSSQDAVRYTFSTVGMALWVTTLALVAGFLVLSLSAFELNSSMGLMTAITITIALVADFLLLPPLLMKLEEIKDGRKKSVAA